MELPSKQICKIRISMMNKIVNTKISTLIFVDRKQGRFSASFARGVKGYLNISITAMSTNSGNAEALFSSYGFRLFLCCGESMMDGIILWTKSDK